MKQSNQQPSDAERGDGRMGQVISLVWSGEKFDAFLKMRGFTTLDEAADHFRAFTPPDLSITRQHLDNWINGRNVPSMKYAPMFRYGLGVKDIVNEFFVESRRPS
jgi:hypothetical protein